MLGNNKMIDIDGKQVRLLSDDNVNGSKKHVFIVGSKGIPAAYGGYETFVECLTKYQVDKNIQYHVSRLSKDNIRFEYNGAYVYDVNIKAKGPQKAIYYDIKALEMAISYCKKNPWIKAPIFYVLACRIGPFFNKYVKQIHRLGGVVYVNPDGHEWMRAKWSKPIRKYWKYSEKLMVKHSDLLVCDSKNIEKYIQDNYQMYEPRTTYIAYGSDCTPSILKDDDKSFNEWLDSKKLKANNYYLVVGRFVPENNYETMIKEFMKSKSTKDFAIITTANDKFLADLENKLHFKSDSRIKFVGTVYDSQLLKKIREKAYAYLHGHEVGGTNPSLLEALGSTSLNLLLDVGFNKEVAEESAFYWNKQPGNLSNLINKVEKTPQTIMVEYSKKAKSRILQEYSWNHIVGLYEELFLK